MGTQPVPHVHTKTLAINKYYSESPNWPYPTGVIQIAGQMPYWENMPNILRPFIRLLERHTIMCFYMTEALPSRESRLIFEEGSHVVGRVPPVHNVKTFFRLRDVAVQTFRRAGYRTLAPRRAPRVWHEVGTARLGDDRSTSVLDPNCQVHGISGLFIVDASSLPSAGAVNPTLTIIALALRAGRHIAKLLA
jgi:choline dehydrogenase-like flavoprotein